MIKKEDFIKRFPINIKCCTVDFTISETCCIDEGRSHDCHYSMGKNGIKKKEDCKYWNDMPNWDYIEDVWEWIDNYQKSNRGKYETTTT